MLNNMLGDFFKVIKKLGKLHVLATQRGENLAHQNGTEILFTNEHLKLENTNYKEYNVGDTVKIRKLTKEQMEDLDSLIYGDSFGSNTLMAEMVRKIYKIVRKKGNGGYKLNAPGELSRFTWRSCWLIPKKIK